MHDGASYDVQLIGSYLLVSLSVIIVWP